MSRHDPRVSILQMRDSAREAIAFVRARDRADLDSDRMLSLALLRLLEVLGEAASRVPAHIREQVADVPWSAIIALRNRVIHGYDSVDHDIVWAVLTRELPPLVESLDRALVGWTD